MSVVLVVAAENFALLMSDGRVSNLAQGKVIKEDFKKLLRVNKNICIGFTGHQRGCEEAIEAINAGMSYAEIVTALHGRAKKAYAVYKDKMIMCVVGFNEKSKMSVNYFTSDDFDIVPYPPECGKVSVISLEPIPTTIFGDKCKKGAFNSLDDYCRLMYETISDISKINPTVNNFTFSELITDKSFYGRN